MVRILDLILIMASHWSIFCKELICSDLPVTKKNHNQITKEILFAPKNFLYIFSFLLFLCVIFSVLVSLQCLSSSFFPLTAYSPSLLFSSSPSVTCPRPLKECDSLSETDCGGKIKQEFGLGGAEAGNSDLAGLCCSLRLEDQRFLPKAPRKRCIHITCQCGCTWQRSIIQIATSS